MKKLAIGLLLSTLSLPILANADLKFDKVWTFNHSKDAAAIESEINAFDKKTGTIWVAGVTGVDILDVATGNKVGFIDTSPFGEINSIVIKRGVAAFAIENKVRTENGIVQFYDTKTKALLHTSEVGPLPDMVTVTKDARKVLVANEGSPDKYGEEIGSSTPKVFGPAANDPAGSVSIIDTQTLEVTTVTLDGVPMAGSNIRMNTGMDFEPEYIAIDQKGEKAYVTLQEANAVAVLDIASAKFDVIYGLGTKDFLLNGNHIDPSDKDDAIAFGAHNVKGFYMPDGIATYEVDGMTYILTANEGDFCEDDGDLVRAKDLGVAAPLDRIRVSNTDSTRTDLYTAGARSFTIWDEYGNIVYDSGDVLDTEAAKRGIYDDKRSDDKGVEPESVEVMKFKGKTYALVGLERTLDSAVAVFDITNPYNVTYLDMIVTPGDVAPEGLKTFKYRGKKYLSISNEKSGTTTLYAVTKKKNKK